jgi:hypothetical protein
MTKVFVKETLVCVSMGTQAQVVNQQQQIVQTHVTAMEDVEMVYVHVMLASLEPIVGLFQKAVITSSTVLDMVHVLMEPAAVCQPGQEKLAIK